MATIVELTQQLEDGVASIRTDADFCKALAVQARFHNYSFGNQMLIAIQRPTATQVAGFGTWLKLGRHVSKGEKGIAIMVPHVYKPKSDEDEGRVGFGTGHVFDIAQTDGEELPDVAPLLTGDDGAELWDRLHAYAIGEGLTVTTVETLNGAAGNYHPTLRAINVMVNAQAQMTKTLAHELGHYLAKVDDRAEGECVAEGVAFVVLAHFGLDSGVRSFPYVATWAKDPKTLRSALGTIQKASGALITAVAS